MGGQSPQVGSDFPRPDGAAKVSGEARYVDDLSPQGLWHGATVRCPDAHAVIERIDAEAARAADADIVVLTAADLPGPNIVKLIKDDQPILADDVVRHPFEAVALVAAPTRERARRAAEAIKVVTRPLPSITTLDQMMERSYEGSHLDRVLSELTIAEGDIKTGFEEADLIIEGTYEVGHQEQMYIEPQGMIAEVLDDGVHRLTGSMQCPYYVVKAISHAFGLTEDKIQVRQTVTGGGFGGKEDYPNVIAAHAALLARAVGRPVKIIYDRTEDINSTTKRHPARIHHRTGVKRDGTLTAVEVEALFDGGAYVTLSPVVLSRGMLHAAGAYRCPHVQLHGLMLATHTAPNGAFRGFGAPQTLFAAERHMDKIARTLGIDPLTLRRKNAYKLGDITPTGQVLTESVSALECLEKAVERTDFARKWAALEAARKARPQGSSAPMKGIGLSLYWHGAGFTGNGENMLKSRAAIELKPGGIVEILTGSTDIGQGTSAVFPQMVADGMGLKAEHVVLGSQDTALVPDSGPTVASRTVMIVGDILARAGQKMGKALRAFVAERHGVDEGDVHIEGEAFVDPHGTRIEGFRAVGDAWLAERGGLRIEEGYESHGRFFDEKTYRGDAYPCFGWACDIIEVSVDPDTLIPTPEHITVACDVGKAINPTLCRGQIEGGTLQAVAWGYLEEIKLTEGRYQNDRMTNYLIPTTLDTPEMDIILVENPYSGGPYGAKGVGEIPMDGGAPALVAAIENATGIAPVTIPATPERLFDDLEAGRVVDGAPSYFTGGISPSQTQEGPQ